MPVRMLPTLHNPGAARMRELADVRIEPSKRKVRKRRPLNSEPRIRSDTKCAYLDGHSAGSDNRHYAAGYEACTSAAIIAWRDGWRAGYARYLGEQKAIREGCRFLEVVNA